MLMTFLLFFHGIHCTLQRLNTHINNLHAAFKRITKENLNPTSSLTGDPYYLAALIKNNVKQCYLWHFILCCLCDLYHTCQTKAFIYKITYFVLLYNIMP